MRYVIISDVHANLEALLAVRAEIERLSPDRILNLGDIVGYGASPSECIETCKQFVHMTVAGNHDFGVSGLTDIRYFNSYARRAVLWTAKALSQEHVEYLGGLPLVHVEDASFRTVHATPSDPGRWDYIFGREQAMIEFGAFDESVCFVGHSHQAGFFEMDEKGAIARDGNRIDVVPGRRYLINVGSVGQPRDGDSRAALCVYDPECGKAEILRVPYDIEGAKRRILEAGLPPILAHRLSHGE